MNNELLLLIKKHTDTLIEQTKARPQETLEFKMSKQMQTYLFSHRNNLLKQGKWLRAVSSFECTNSVFKTNNENNSFSITIPSHWESKSAEKTIDDLNKLLELRSENIIELHVREVRKRGNQIKIGDKDYLNISDLDTLKNSTIKELKRVKYRDLEDLVFRLQINYHEIVEILDVKYISTKRMGYSLKPNIYNVVDLNNTLKKYSTR